MIFVGVMSDLVVMSLLSIVSLMLLVFIPPGSVYSACIVGVLSVVVVPSFGDIIDMVGLLRSCMVKVYVSDVVICGALSIAVIDRVIVTLFWGLLGLVLGFDSVKKEIVKRLGRH